MFRKLPNHTGIALTALISLVVLSLFYGNIFNKLNKVCFADGGDGMQSFVNMEYHILYDTNYLRCNSMNYPYGEHVFFTNNQPLISNTIKFINENVVEISGYTLGILNFIMLFCLVITPVIIYLILTDFGVGQLLASPAAIGITYLTPQLERFTGHFNLAYVCAIPLMILLLIRFFRRPSALLSAIISITVMAGALTHFYLYGFYAIIIVFFYAAYAFNKKRIFKNNRAWVIHLFVQLLIPFIILQVFYFFDHVTDRTVYPWGFFYYRAYPQSIFLPLNKPYGRFLHNILNFSYIDWEGYAYAGLLAVAGTIAFGVIFLKRLIKKRYRLIWQVTPEFQLNILFWASLVALLYSFGLPFILGLQSLVDLIGPIRQMRGIARFSWIFFYVMNIITIYWLWDWWKNRGKKAYATVIIIVSLTILFYDAYYNVRGRGKLLENHFPALTDRNLVLPENQWINNINTSGYQAMIPLPYFHIGSENTWIDGNCDIMPKSFTALARSGLPSMGVSLSRTSINQTFNNVALMLEPSEKSVNMEPFPSEKPFLLLAARCNALNAHEKQLINHAAWIDSSGTFDIYELPFNAFHNILDSISEATEKEYQHLTLFEHNGLQSTDSTQTFRYVNFDSMNVENTFRTRGCYVGKAKDINNIFAGNIPYADTSLQYIISFWMNNVRKDLYPRTSAVLAETGPGGETIRKESFQVFRHFVTIEENKALIEYKFRISDPANQISLSLQNKTLHNNTLQIDDLLIRPEKTSLYYMTKESIWKNNRFYKINTLIKTKHGSKFMHRIPNEMD